MPDLFQDWLIYTCVTARFLDQLGYNDSEAMIYLDTFDKYKFVRGK